MPNPKYNPDPDMFLPKNGDGSENTVDYRALSAETGIPGLEDPRTRLSAYLLYELSKGSDLSAAAEAGGNLDPDLTKEAGYRSSITAIYENAENIKGKDGGFIEFLRANKDNKEALSNMFRSGGNRLLQEKIPMFNIDNPSKSDQNQLDLMELQSFTCLNFARLAENSFSENATKHTAEFIPLRDSLSKGGLYEKIVLDKAYGNPDLRGRAADDYIYERNKEVLNNIKTHELALGMGLEKQDRFQQHAEVKVYGIDALTLTAENNLIRDFVKSAETAPVENYLQGKKAEINNGIQTTYGENGLRREAEIDVRGMSYDHIAPPHAGERRQPPRRPGFFTYVKSLFGSKKSKDAIAQYRKGVNEYVAAEREIGNYVKNADYRSVPPKMSERVEENTRRNELRAEALRRQEARAAATQRAHEADRASTRQKEEAEAAKRREAIVKGTDIDYTPDPNRFMPKNYDYAALSKQVLMPGFEDPKTRLNFFLIHALNSKNATLEDIFSKSDEEKQKMGRKFLDYLEGRPVRVDIRDENNLNGMSDEEKMTAYSEFANTRYSYASLLKGAYTNMKKEKMPDFDTENPSKTHSSVIQLIDLKASLYSDFTKLAKEVVGNIHESETLNYGFDTAENMEIDLKKEISSTATSNPTRAYNSLVESISRGSAYAKMVANCANADKAEKIQDAAASKYIYERNKEHITEMETMVDKRKDLITENGEHKKQSWGHDTYFGEKETLPNGKSRTMQCNAATLKEEEKIIREKAHSLSDEAAKAYVENPGSYKESSIFEREEPGKLSEYEQSGLRKQARQQSRGEAKSAEAENKGPSAEQSGAIKEEVGEEKSAVVQLNLKDLVSAPAKPPRVTAAVKPKEPQIEKEASASK